jgi:hypothetical protein
MFGVTDASKRISSRGIAHVSSEPEGTSRRERTTIEKQQEFSAGKVTGICKSVCQPGSRMHAYILGKNPRKTQKCI